MNNKLDFSLNIFIFIVIQDIVFILINRYLDILVKRKMISQIRLLTAYFLTCIKS